MFFFKWWEISNAAFHIKIHHQTEKTVSAQSVTKWAHELNAHLANRSINIKVVAQISYQYTNYVTYFEAPQNPIVGLPHLPVPL